MLLSRLARGTLYHGGNTVPDYIGGLIAYWSSAIIGKATARRNGDQSRASLEDESTSCAAI